jgi:hypothetical protein
MNHHDEKDDESREGQVSEMVPDGDVPEPISPGDSVAAQPDGESGEAQEGTQGPNAIPDDPTGDHPHTT